jgi:hypothetical protein
MRAGLVDGKLFIFNAIFGPSDAASQAAFHIHTSMPA